MNNLTHNSRNVKSKAKNYTFKAYDGNKLVTRLQTHSVRRFLARLRSFANSKVPLRCYLRVSYGKHKDVWGKLDTFYNDCWVNSKEKSFNEITKKWENELLKTFYAFDEIDSGFFDDEPLSMHRGADSAGVFPGLAAPSSPERSLYA